MVTFSGTGYSLSCLHYLPRAPICSLATGLTSSLPWKLRRCAIVQSSRELGGRRESSCVQASRVSGEASGDASTERTYCLRESGEKTQRVPTTHAMIFSVLFRKQYARCIPTCCTRLDSLERLSRCTVACPVFLMAVDCVHLRAVLCKLLAASWSISNLLNRAAYVVLRIALGIAIENMTQQ